VNGKWNELEPDEVRIPEVPVGLDDTLNALAAEKFSCVCCIFESLNEVETFLSLSNDEWNIEVSHHIWLHRPFRSKECLLSQLLFRPGVDDADSCFKLSCFFFSVMYGKRNLRLVFEVSIGALFEVA